MQNYKKNDIIELTITGMTAEGNGVGRIHEGMAVFVPMTAVGDVIRCKLVKLNKSFAYGIIDEIITPAPDRILSDCEVYKKCGGCTFRHISYEAELKIKDSLVKDAFKRLGKLDIPFENILGCQEQNFYRNKAQYPVADQDGKAVCGFYSKRSHRIVNYTACKLHPPVFENIVNMIINYVNSNNIQAYDEKTNKGLLRHIYIRQGYNSHQIMICLVITKPIIDKFKILADKLISEFPDIKSIILNINSKNTNVILGNENITIGEKNYISDVFCGNIIELSPLSFYQVNTKQAEQLYAIAKEYAELTGKETLIDLYCGTGTIGLFMADMCKNVIGCEIVPEAVENAKHNALINNINNAEFFCGDAGKTAEMLADSNIKPDVVIVDPPRKGCDELTLLSIIKMSPKKIIMISCNPATAARDAAFLAKKGYTPIKARAIDLFARTGHVECVVLITRNI
jgi:23S rRNA (uracil1939-C5)-methyltransferase